MTQMRCDCVFVYVHRHREHGPEFLLLLRAPGKYMGGTWQPVSGGIHPGENAVQAALREMQEECSLVPDRLYSADAIASFYVAEFDTVWHCPVLVAEVPGDAEVRLNAEHTDYDWVHVNDLPSRLMWPEQRRIVEQIVQEIINDGPSKPYLRVTLP